MSRKLHALLSSKVLFDCNLEPIAEFKGVIKKEEGFAEVIIRQQGPDIIGQICIGILVMRKLIQSWAKIWFQRLSLHLFDLTIRTIRPYLQNLPHKFILQERIISELSLNLCMYILIPRYTITLILELLQCCLHIFKKLIIGQKRLDVIDHERFNDI